ncbi:unnamed protein product, partial [marine sediment metagenome]
FPLDFLYGFAEVMSKKISCPYYLLLVVTRSAAESNRVERFIIF